MRINSHLTSFAALAFMVMLTIGLWLMRVQADNAQFAALLAQYAR